MKKLLLFFIVFTLSANHAQISIHSSAFTYSQDFNTLANSGSSSELPNGWSLYETGTNANTKYSANSGTSNSGDTYSFGAALDNDRSLGSIQSGSLISKIGVVFINNTGQPILKLPICYRGEQWRLGSISRKDRLDFEYSIDATNLFTGTWITVDSLDFVGLLSAGTTGAKNGNDIANRDTIIYTISGLNIPDGATIWLRWSDFNASGADDGLAIDDFSFNPFAIDITGGILLTPPNLIADDSFNNVDNNIEITFPDNAAWRTSVKMIKIDSTQLTLNTDYQIGVGTVTLKPEGGNPLLTSAGLKNIIILAVGYSSAVVTQQIEAGEPTENSSAVIDKPLIVNSNRTVTVTAKDHYNNLVRNYVFKYEISVTDSSSVTDESYLIDGTPRTSSIQNVDFNTVTNENGEASFTIAVPEIVDGNDGVSVQVKLNDGLTNIGDAFSSYQKPSELTLIGVDPSSANFPRNSTNNVLYRIQINAADANTVLTFAKFITGGDYSSTDINANGFSLYFSPDSTFETTDTKLGTLNSSSTGAGDTLIFTKMNQPIIVGTGYIILTVDLSSDAAINKTIKVNTSSNSDFTFSSSLLFKGSSFAIPNSHTIFPALVEPPVVNEASNITMNCFTANWNFSADASNYLLDVSTTNDFTSFVGIYNALDVSNVFTFNVTGLKANTIYYYRVRAYNLNGASNYSNLVSLTTASPNEQIISAGEIAILGINTDDPDQFAFVPLVDLESGTVIRFTDSGVKSDGVFRGGEGAVKYTTPFGGITKGTIITFKSPASGDFSADNDSKVGTSGLSLAASGDQLFAFQGESTSPRFIYGVNSYRNVWQLDATNSNTTALPLTLINGTNAVAVGAPNADHDNAVYNMSITSGSKNELLAAFSNNSNWNVSNTSLSMPAGVILITDGTLSIPNPPVAIQAAEILVNGFTANWNSTNGAAKYYLDIAADSNFTKLITGFNNYDAGNSTSAVITELNQSTKYYYRVRGENSAGTSRNSNIISVTTASNQTLVQFLSAEGKVYESAGSFNLVLTIENPDANNAVSFQVVITRGTGDSTDVNGYTSQTVTFPAGSIADQIINLTITNDYFAEGNETIVFSIINLTGGSSAVVGVNNSFILTISDPIIDYYAGVNSTLTGPAMKTELHNLIKGHTAFPYTGSSTDVWNILMKAYEDPTNTENIILLYTGRSQAKAYNASTFGTDANAWNREHVWPQSRGGFDVENISHNPGIASDAHNLAPEDASVNSDRGNKDFDFGGAPHFEAVGSKMDTDSFEPRDAVKGDVARMLFYMDVRYEGDIGEVQLELAEGVNTPVGTMGKLSTLLLWHQQDPPDSFEINRNNVIFSFQRNKNPFIDHPEWVSSIYGINAAPVISNIRRNYTVPGEDQNLSINAYVIDEGTVSNVQLIYTVNGGFEQIVSMTLEEGNTYNGIITENYYSDGDLLQYKIKAVDNEGLERISESYRVFTGITAAAKLHQTDSNGIITYNNVYARVKGIATVGSGIFSTTSLETVLEDATGGITIYKVPPSYVLFIENKKYTVSGMLTQFNGLIELTPDNVSTDIIENGAGTFVTPTIMSIANLLANAEINESKLVKISNVYKIEGNWGNGQNLIVNDGTASLTLHIDSSTSLGAAPEPNWPKDITGIFSQYDTALPFTEEYQLKPRRISDFTESLIASSYRVSASEYTTTSCTPIIITAQLLDQFGSPIHIENRRVKWTSTNGGTFSSPASLTDASGVATIYFYTSNFGSATHKISAVDEQSVFGISNEIISTGIEIPKLIYPENQVADCPINLIFEWSSVSKMDCFELQISDKEDFSNLISSVENIKNSSYEKRGLELFTKYYWRVRARRGITGSEWSACWSFKTKSGLPCVPQIVFPANNSIKVSVNTLFKWNKAEDAENYSIQVSDANDFSKIIFEERGITSPNILIENLKHKTKYYWRVNASNTIGACVYSEISTFITIDTIFAPTNLSVSADSNSHVSISWQDISDNETGFRIERSCGIIQSFTEIKIIGADTTLFLDKSTHEGKTYHYKIFAFNNEVQSTKTPETSITLPLISLKSPSDIYTNNIGEGLEITWKDNSNNESGFIIEREERGNSLSVFNKHSSVSSFVQIGKVDADSKKYIDSNVIDGKIYLYSVLAFNDDGFSIPAFSNNESIFIDAPSKITLAVKSDQSILLQWEDNSSVEDGYFIERVTHRSEFDSAKFILKAGSNIFHDENLIDGIYYSYKINAFTNKGEKSCTVQSNTLLVDLNAPTEFKAEPTADNKIKMTWKDNSGSESGYVIERYAYYNNGFVEIANVLANFTELYDLNIENGKSYTYRVIGFNENVKSVYSNEAKLVFTNVADNSGLPQEYKLEQNYPNPFNPETVIRYALPVPSYVTLKVYDLLGREAAILVDKEQQPGFYNVKFNSNILLKNSLLDTHQSTLSSGIYFYGIEAGDFKTFKKMLLLK